MAEPPAILIFFAHPDDERFFVAGTVRKYTAAGVRVMLCCATRAERGTAGTPPLTTVDRLGSVREQELRAAASVLGITDLHLLPYEDQQLQHVPIAEVRAALVGLPRRYRPAVVVTFDPDGGGGHPDHIAISRFTSEAVAAAADPRCLPELGAAHRAARLVWACPVMPWAETNPRALAQQPGVDFLIDVAPWRDIKTEALKLHRTQHEGIARLFLARPDRDAILGCETFRLGPGVPVDSPADDLFARIL